MLLRASGGMAILKACVGEPRRSSRTRRSWRPGSASTRSSGSQDRRRGSTSPCSRRYRRRLWTRRTRTSPTGEPDPRVFDAEGVRFAHEVHPSEIAYDYFTTARALEAIGHRPTFGLNWDPSHFVWQAIDPVMFLWDFRERIYHVDCKDTRLRTGDGRRGCRVRTCHGETLGAGGTSSPPVTATSPWEDCFRMLNTIGYGRAAVRRMGGRRHGPSRRRAGGPAVRRSPGLRPAVGGVRCCVLDSCDPASRLGRDDGTRPPCDAVALKDNPDAQRTQAPRLNGNRAQRSRLTTPKTGHDLATQVPRGSSP